MPGDDRHLIEKAAADLAYIGGYGDLFRGGWVAFQADDLTEPRWIRRADERLDDEVAVPVPDNSGLSESDFLAKCARAVQAAWRRSP